LFDETVSRDDVEFTAYSMDWQVVDKQDASVAVPFRLIYRPPGSTGLVSYVEDAVVALRYLETDDRAAGALDSIRTRLSMYDAEHVLASLRGAQSADEARLALRSTAVMAPQVCEPQWYEAIGPWFDNPHRGVRLTAVLVAAYLAWPELAPLLEHLAASDLDTDVREDARVLLERMRRGLARIQ